MILLSKKRGLDKAVEREVEAMGMDKEEVNTAGGVLVGVEVEVKAVGMDEEEVNTAGGVLVGVEVEVRVIGVVQPVQVLQDANLTTVIRSGPRQQPMFM